MNFADCHGASWCKKRSKHHHTGLVPIIRISNRNQRCIIKRNQEWPKRFRIESSMSVCPWLCVQGDRGKFRVVFCWLSGRLISSPHRLSRYHLPRSWYTTLPTGVFSSRLNRAMSPLPGIKCGVRLMICARAHCCSSTTSTSRETSFTLGCIILVHECTAMVCSAPARAASEPASTGLVESSSGECGWLGLGLHHHSIAHAFRNWLGSVESSALSCFFMLQCFLDFF